MEEGEQSEKVGLTEVEEAERERERKGGKERRDSIFCSDGEEGGKGREVDSCLLSKTLLPLSGFWLSKGNLR